MKKILINYYKYRLSCLVEAQKDYSRYLCLYGDNDTLECIGLKLKANIEEIKFLFFEGFLPKRWIEE